MDVQKITVIDLIIIDSPLPLSIDVGMVIICHNYHDLSFKMMIHT